MKRRPRGVALAAACFAIAVSCVVPSWADVPASELTPPKAIDAGQVPYPESGSGDAEVVIELGVDPAGGVREVKVLDGAPPFADAVRAAATKFTFEPARRAGIPVASRIRMRIAFHPSVTAPVAPAPADGGAPPPPRTAPATSSVTAIEEVEDVTVFGARKEVGQVSLGAGEVRQIPGAFGDPFRAMEALPGVTPVASGLPFFFVRGAPPGNTGYFLDGIPVPLLYHVAVGPGVVHPSLIDHVDFFPGGYPARFGRFSGGILSGETVGRAEHAKIEGNLRLFDVGLLAQTPFGPENRGEALVGGRYGYPGPIISLFAPDTRVAYWDYQARFGWRFTDVDTVSLFAFGAYDEIALRDRKPIYYGAAGPFGEELTDFYPVFRTTFHRVDLRWDHRIGKSGGVRTAFTVGRDETLVTGAAGQAAASVGWIVNGRTSYEERLSPAVKVRAGADVLFGRFDVVPSVDLEPWERQNAVPTKTDVDFGVRGDMVLRVHPRIEVVPGLRVDYYSSTPTIVPGAAPPVGNRGILAVDPRVASRINITNDFALVTTFGVAHQKPSTAAPIAGLAIGTLSDGLQTSIQASQGIDLKLPLGFQLTVTGFMQDLFNLTDQLATCNVIGGESPRGCAVDRVRGRTFGAELLLRRDLTKRISGWISYTLSRSTRETNGLHLPIPIPSRFEVFQGSEILSEYDRTHVFNFVGAVDLGRGWRFGTRFNVYSGRPYTARAINGTPIPPFNAERMPTFWRLDVRVEKEWKLGDRGRVAFVIEGLNVTLNREPLNAVCSAGLAAIQDCTITYFGPVTIPSIGVEASY